MVCLCLDKQHLIHGVMCSYLKLGQYLCAWMGVLKDSKKTSVRCPQSVTHQRVLPCSVCPVLQVSTDSWPTPRCLRPIVIAPALNIEEKSAAEDTFPSHLFWASKFLHSLYVPAQPWNANCIWGLFDSNNPFYSLNLLNHRFNTPSLSHAIDFTATIAALSSDESFFTGQEEENQFQSPKQGINLSWLQ